MLHLIRLLPASIIPLYIHKQVRTTTTYFVGLVLIPQPNFRSLSNGNSHTLYENEEKNVEPLSEHLLRRFKHRLVLSYRNRHC